jgi:hypothetical protein
MSGDSRFQSLTVLGKKDIFLVSIQQDSSMLQRLKWRPLANRRKDARLMMMYKIDRELVSITKENIFNQRANKHLVGLFFNPD